MTNGKTAVAYLLLEDGTLYKGASFGYRGDCFGEVVFNTGMTGYQEVLTDPSYCGQIVTMTYPLIGNYGINTGDAESTKPQVRGFLVREACARPSHYRSEKTVEHYLAQHGIPGLAGIDTRSVTRRIRNYGTMRGAIISGEAGADAGLDSLRVGACVTLAELMPQLTSNTQAIWQGYLNAVRQQVVAGPHLVQQVTTPQAYVIPGDGRRVVVLDFGIKENILRMLKALDCHLIVLPADASPEDIYSAQPEGIFLSNGPGDPKDVKSAVGTVQALLAPRADFLPMFGICLGHQLLSLALGGDTYKLKFGHRGANHPVRDLATGRVMITSQNHGYAIREATLPPTVIVSHRNANDDTVEGLRHVSLPVYSVQYHPEAAPGPEDSTYLFDTFMAHMGARAKA
ncbi:glutamine-hydrolyzing carbamoyl-phosphate synthase small subunit [Heliophilum fasciatum]|uniref:Carbamoyl phosphate synthase small chain n=1 Tax=Heliophilum fasciatum TaxID=35700 RepID=A0A4R2RRH8_9FIRM|nr:glutamine-hydrolyzing carbamoyl-phosphate synthase small subunit [Heliophilum fasciatum]MCW2278975.1 carbamoyl-phosphate synthase small subunit [Heliophilum fasciatum]TCP61775.1 carbamoyl-phosphate synthase small subunit [Heliophilum fasciatum]